MTFRINHLARHQDARNATGQPCKIAIATVIHENGEYETVAINEDLIRFAGEGIIEKEVARAMTR